MWQLWAMALRECLFLLGYVTGRSEFPKALSRAEEEEAVARMLQGDEQARETLITHNLRLVSHIARKYQVPGYGADDLISIGVVGLMKAVGTYKPGNGSTLGTYAARCIENEILMTLRASRKHQGEVSLQEPMGNDGEGNELTLIDVLGTEQDALEEEVIRRVTMERVRHALVTLPKRERLVLEMRYGLSDGQAHPQHEIAEILGISRSYVSRVEKHALTLLKKAL